MIPWPRCDMRSCRASAAGVWRWANGKGTPLCVDHRDEMEDLMTEHPLEGWESFTPSAVETATADRLARMADGYFG